MTFEKWIADHPRSAAYAGWHARDAEVEELRARLEAGTAASNKMHELVMAHAPHCSTFESALRHIVIARERAEAACLALRRFVVLPSNAGNGFYCAACDNGNGDNAEPMCTEDGKEKHDSTCPIAINPGQPILDRLAAAERLADLACKFDYEGWTGPGNEIAEARSAYEALKSK